MAGIRRWTEHPLVIFLLVAGLAILSYANTFSASFHFDDFQIITENSRIKTLGNFWDMTRPRYVGLLSFALNYRVDGLNVVGYHVVNLAIHITNSLLVYLLVAQLFRSPALRSSAPVPQARDVALLTALLFAIHPVQTQAVTYIVQRFTSLAALFYLLAVVLYLQWRLSAAGTRGRWGWYVGALAATILAMKTKENTFTLPFMLMVVEGVCFGFVTWKRWLPFIPFLLTLSIIPLAMAGIMGKAEAGFTSGFTRETTDISRLSYLFTQCRVLVTYLRLVVLPIGQNLDYDYPIYDSLFDLPVLFSALGLLGFLGGGLTLLRAEPPNRLVGFGLVWLFLALAVESSIIPIRDVIYEHRMYLPSVGVFLAASALGARLLARMRRGWALGTAAVVIGVLAIATYQRNEVWRDDVTLWLDVVEKSPRKGRSHDNLGLAYLAQDRLDAAIEKLKTALQLAPHDTEIHVNLGNAYVKQGKMETAIESYQTALRMGGDSVKVHYNLGHVYLLQGRFDAAIEELKTALQLDPSYGAAHGNLGVAYDRQGRLDAAAEEYRTAIHLDPESAKTHDNLGRIYWQRGNLEAAIAEHQTAIALKADLPDAHYNLANVYSQQGKPAAAIMEYQTALRLRPDFVEAHNNLGNAYLAQGRRDEAIAEFQAAVRLQPASPEYHYNLGNAYLGYERFDEAIAEFLTSARLRPEFPEAYSKLGTAYAQQRRWDEAIAHYRHALQLRPDFVAVHFSLGRVYALKGWKPAARQEFETVLRYRPDFAPAQQALKLLDGQS